MSSRLGVQGAPGRLRHALWVHFQMTSSGALHAARPILTLPIEQPTTPQPHDCLLVHSRGTASPPPPPWREGFEHVLSSEALLILRFAVGVSRIDPKN